MRMTMELRLDEQTTELVNKLARRLGVEPGDIVAKAIVNEAFIVENIDKGKTFQLRDRNQTSAVDFA